jgi:hypothetical protein
LLPTPAAQRLVQPEVAPPSKSDTYAVTLSGKKERVQRREVASANFRISGVDLASDEDVLLRAAKMLGESPIESSGDASTASHEACYESAGDGDNTHLIFGRGEVDFWFTLSSDGSVWEGKHGCTKSAKITRDIATDSGLHLGLSKQQVISVLGLATNKQQSTRQHAETLTYSLESKGKTDSQTLARWWQQEIKKTPAANHQEFLENYEFYTLEVYISARFVNDSLTRLYISWSAQY